MKPISTGAGLVALSIGMVATALVAAHRTGSEAWAQRSGSAADSLATTSAGRELGAAEIARGSDAVSERSSSSNFAPTHACVTAPNAASWFASTPHITGCDPGTWNATYLGSLPIGAADVNGDGRLEYFESPSPNGTANQITASGPVLFRSETQFAAGVTTLTKTCVLNITPDVTTNMFAAFGTYYPRVDLSHPLRGWRDMDGDGDLDLLVIFICYPNNWTMNPTGFYEAWFENTGYQSAPPPNPFDLDRDGHVNTADVSLLLMGFTD